VAPDGFVEELRGFDAMFLGAVGWPQELPDHVTLSPLITIRQRLDLYACVRPARLPPGVHCPLADRGPEDVDFVVIRENSEGEYLPVGGRVKQGRPEEIALQTAVHTRRGIERILRFGFEMAGRRRNKLTMITKSNAQGYAFVLWDEILEELRPQYPRIEADKQHVDAAAMNFVRRPDFFDVVVASNLFGDILTDLGAVVSGGMGLAPSANINPEREHPSLFEPVHGSAPDIAGQGIANPVAAILSAAMMLDWLGLSEESRRMRAAVETTLEQGHGTPDLGGKLKTSELTDRVLDNL
ncbi:MAG: isocitrate/isopropylmalate family dehydrogenase, partial [Planctomycetales bacterium]